jgi:hypothetical protein
MQQWPGVWGAGMRCRHWPQPRGCGGGGVAFALYRQKGRSCRAQPRRMMPADVLLAVRGHHVCSSSHRLVSPSCSQAPATALPADHTPGLRPPPAFGTHSACACSPGTRWNQQRCQGERARPGRLPLPALPHPRPPAPCSPATPGTSSATFGLVGLAVMGQVSRGARAGWSDHLAIVMQSSPAGLIARPVPASPPAGPRPPGWQQRARACCHTATRGSAATAGGASARRRLATGAPAQAPPAAGAPSSMAAPPPPAPPRRTLP